MSEQFGGDLITLTDDEGNEHELEHLDTLELNSNIYMAFVPSGIPEDSEEPTELILLKVVSEDGEEILSTIDDEAELESVYAAFMESVIDDEDEISGE